MVDQVRVEQIDRVIAPMIRSVIEHYRCPERYLNVVTECDQKHGCETFDHDQRFRICSASGSDGSVLRQETPPVAVHLSAKPENTIEDLRFERYANANGYNAILQSSLASFYYFCRPILPIAIRKHIQRACLGRWKKLQFPRWPVDTTVDDLLASLLLGTMRAHSVSRVPFIWFWPEGASSCAIMTHDVETQAGLDYVPALMNVDAAFDIPASFQIVPEGRYSVSAGLLDTIRERGFEINVQDLNHDGLLFREKREFLRRAERINWYADRFSARGFRSAVLYRRLEWFKALKFEYDMSVPNVAHLDPQRGGCCTVMPYFVDHMLELPVTTTQDYSLFHILNDYSLTLWKQQIELIRQKHGLISFIVHPDYVIDASARRVYESLLRYLTELRRDKGVWIASPGEVNDWWRQRSQLRLVEEGTNWRIEGPGKERARIAYATEQGGQLAISVEGQDVCNREQ